MALNTGPDQVDDITKSFDLELKACTIENYDHKPLVCMGKLGKWMLEKVSDEDGKETIRLDGLLQVVYSNRGPHHPGRITAERVISKGGLTVFCILLKLGRGNAIDIFLGHNINDSRLSLARAELERILRKTQLSNPSDLAIKFYAAQCQFKVRKFELDYEAVYDLDEPLPICKRVLRSKKGGTAKLYTIFVLEEFVDDSLKEKLLKGKCVRSNDCERSNCGQVRPYHLSYSL